VTYVGHSMVSDPGLLKARGAQQGKAEPALRGDLPATCVILPGSRSSELKRLLPALERATAELSARMPGVRFILPAVPRHEHRIRKAVEDWAVRPEVVVGAKAKWAAFAEADAAIAASGTVLLELALVGVPCVSIYKLDALAKLLTWRIKAWTAALPNMIADYPVIPEYVNESVRPARLARWVERLTADTLQRKAMIEGFDRVRDAMRTVRNPAEHAADVILDVLATKQSG